MPLRTFTTDIQIVRPLPKVMDLNDPNEHQQILDKINELINETNEQTLAILEIRSVINALP